MIAMTSIYLLNKNNLQLDNKDLKRQLDELS